MVIRIPYEIIPIKSKFDPDIQNRGWFYEIDGFRFIFYNEYIQARRMRISRQKIEEKGKLMLP